jgi:hypothetical protein
MRDPASVGREPPILNNIPNPFSSQPPSRRALSRSMRPKISWFDEEQHALYIEWETSLTWQDFLDAVQAISTTLDGNAEAFALVLDFHYRHVPQRKALYSLVQAMFTLPKPIRLVIVARAHRYAHLLFATARRLHPRRIGRLEIVTTTNVEAARAFLRQTRKPNEKHKD